jgi:hypothetical protein
MALSRTDRERYVLVAAALDLEAKQARERAGLSHSPFQEFHWQNRCTEAAETIRELLERREKEEPVAPAIVEGGTTPQARKV